jgi:beta-N-acetylhexosaminidase
MRSLFLLVFLTIATMGFIAEEAAEMPATTFAPSTAAPRPTTATTVVPTTTTISPTTTTTLPSGTVSEDARAVVLAGLPGVDLDEATGSFLADGGRAVVVFSKNLASPAQVRELTAAMACAAGADLLVAVDQEPGRVDRLVKIGIPSPAVDSERDEFIADTLAMGEAMIDLGINFDLAPVLDVARGFNPVLVGRSFGPDPELVAERGLDFRLALESVGVVTTAKHFPGHGLSMVDPHLQVTPIAADIEILEAVDFPPFRSAIDNGIGAVMVGHPIYEALDPSSPASLSPAVLELLRSGFGFDGVAVTDAFSMAGVREGRTLGEVTVEALIAGEDLLIVDDPLEVSEVVAVIERAVADGTLSRDRLAEAAGRVRRLAMSAAPVVCNG